MSAEARLAAKLAELGMELPPAPEPKGVYRPLLVLGNLVYTSGHLPIDASGADLLRTTVTAEDLASSRGYGAVGSATAEAAARGRSGGTAASSRRVYSSRGRLSTCCRIRAMRWSTTSARCRCA